MNSHSTFNNSSSEWPLHENSGARLQKKETGCNNHAVEMEYFGSR